MGLKFVIEGERYDTTQATSDIAHEVRGRDQTKARASELSRSCLCLRLVDKAFVAIAIRTVRLQLHCRQRSQLLVVIPRRPLPVHPRL